MLDAAPDLAAPADAAQSDLEVDAAAAPEVDTAVAEVADETAADLATADLGEISVEVEVPADATEAVADTAAAETVPTDGVAPETTAPDAEVTDTDTQAAPDVAQVDQSAADAIAADAKADTPPVVCDCDDGNPCSTDGCDAAGVCQYAANTASCDDGNACTQGDVCAQLKCSGQQAVTCSDGIACTADACDPKVGCAFTAQAKPCDDGNGCTTDSCDGKAGCAQVAATGACDDGNACTLGDTCNAKLCSAGKPKPCEDGNLCTTDGCAPLTGCTVAAAATACDDGNACTDGDLCDKSQCVPGKPKACSDGNPCTADTCSAPGGCAFAPTAGNCDDGSACTTADACAAGVCKGGPPLPCDDKNGCTQDSCDGKAGCTAAPSAGPCSDGSACTVSDVCASGQCKAGSPLGCDDANPCTTDTCDPKVGCAHANAATPCDDGNPCSTGDACAGGKCAPGTVKTCDDGNGCTSDSCSPSNGACVSLPAAITCSDGNPCTVGDACDKGACKPGPAGTCGKLAVIGDFGKDGKPEADVAALVKSWSPEIVLTTGDNTYLQSTNVPIDQNIGKHYAQFIHPYKGAYGPGSPDVNRFFPTIGNHDWDDQNGVAYFNYFTLPGNERYYDLTWLGLRLFSIDSDTREPDGTTAASTQGKWLQGQLASCKAAHCMVFFHHPSYTSSSVGNSTYMRWPYAAWGASSVWMGHAHIYERLDKDGIPHIVQGLGGADLHGFGTIMAGTELRYNADFGATLLEVQGDWVKQTMITRGGLVVDQSWLPPKALLAPAAPPTSLLAAGSTWKYLDTGAMQANWTTAAFNDGAWKQGPAQLGYGDGDEKTIVAYGNSANNKYITTWFRRTIQVTDPTAFAGLDIGLLRDDGAVVYLNGKEVFRSNMPAGTITATTLASGTPSAAEESTFVHQIVSADGLVAGANVVAVEVHQAAADSSDLSFDLELLAQPKASAALVPAKSNWTYRDNGQDPGNGWWTASYDDSSWKSGAGPLGYGGIGEATVVGFGGNANGKHVTTWFRKTFSVPAGGPPAKGYKLRLRRDDGVVVRLNGVEVQRLNLPLGTVAATTLAGVALSGGMEADWVTTWLPPGLIGPGVNVLAVEVHQNAANSPDLMFEAELLVGL